MSVSRRTALKSGFAIGASAIIDRTASANPAVRPAQARLSAAPAPLLTLEDYERAARERIDPVAWEYIASGAADEITVRWNIDAYRSVRLVPRQLRDVSTLDLSVNLLGHRLAHPILLAPTASHKLAHPDGEVGTARGARAAGAGMVLSSYSTVPVELVAAEKPPLFWFQLYVQERGYTEPSCAEQSPLVQPPLR
jgi:4-hydroxymandelate oxidase